MAGGLFTGFSLRPQAQPMLLERETRVIPIHELEGEAFIGWLAKLAVRALVTSLVAQKVSEWSGSCSCNGSACSKGTAASSDYYNTDGVYGYDPYDRRFLTQNIRDSKVKFTNVSVPFMTGANAQIMNIEGPFLAGMCLGAEEVSTQYSAQTARKLFIPRSEISNGGYRFDTDPCAPTLYKTAAGSTKIDYAAHSWGGTVKVTARDNAGTALWSRNYDLT